MGFQPSEAVVRVIKDIVEIGQVLTILVLPPSSDRNPVGPYKLVAPPFYGLPTYTQMVSHTLLALEVLTLATGAPVHVAIQKLGASTDALVMHQEFWHFAEGPAVLL